jgi:hypothetical protein
LAGHPGWGRRDWGSGETPGRGDGSDSLRSIDPAGSGVIMPAKCIGSAARRSRRRSGYHASRIVPSLSTPRRGEGRGERTPRGVRPGVFLFPRTNGSTPSPRERRAPAPEIRVPAACQSDGPAPRSVHLDALFHESEKVGRYFTREIYAERTAPSASSACGRARRRTPPSAWQCRRWYAAGLLRAESKFRRMKGHRAMPARLKALEAVVGGDRVESGGPLCENAWRNHSSAPRAVATPCKRERI